MFEKMKYGPNKNNNYSDKCRSNLNFSLHIYARKPPHRQVDPDRKLKFSRNKIELIRTHLQHSFPKLDPWRK